MGKRNRRKRSGERDVSTIANFVARPTVISAFRAPLLSDRRMFHPEGPFAPVYSTRKDQRVVHDRNVNIGRDVRSKRFRSVFEFAVPQKIDLCVRRHRRKEVLFALNRTGKGARSPKRRNYWSDVKC